MAAFRRWARVALTWMALGASCAGSAAWADAEQIDLLSAAERDGHYTRFVAAARETGLARQLQQGRGYTVFAPTDQAFEALKPAVRDKLLAPASRDRLTDILDLHVVKGDYTLESALQRASLSSEQGQALKFARSDNDVMVNDAKVVRDGVTASNGRLYGIDKVLMPRQ